MNIVIGDLLTIEGKKYVVMEVLAYNNENYAFVNMMTEEEEATDKFFVFKIIDDENIRIVIDEEVKKVLLPKFQEMLTNDIKNLFEE